MRVTKTLTLSCLAVATLFGTSLVETSMADPLDKASPKIAEGMYRDRGKSSPKIAEGMYRDRGKSSPKIAEGMYKGIDKSSPKIAHGMYKEIDKSSPKIAHRTRRGRVRMNVVGMEVEDLVRELGYWRGGR